jgi:hypothetical protein
MSNAIANQLYLAYLGRPADTAWRSSTTAVLAGGAPSVALQNAFYSAAVLDGTFSLSDSSSQLVNKIFLNLGLNNGAGASTFEQNAWATLINNGTITAQTAAWTIFTSYANATNVPAATYQVPLQSKLLVIDAYTNQLANDPAANLAMSSLGSSAANTSRTTITSITSQATAAAAITGIATTVSGVSTSQTGSSFNLTTGVDNLTGTSSNDTFTADNTATAKQLTVADTINGGAGTDTLRVFLATGDTATGQPTLTSIENVYINGGAITAYTAATGTTGLIIDSPVANTEATYTVNGQAVTLRNHTVTADKTTTIAGNTPTSLALTLDGQTRTGTNTNTIDLSGTAVATLALTSSTTASVITLTNTGTALRTINLDGAANATITTNAAVSGALTTFNAAAATGNVSLNTSAAVNAAAFAFTGGSGNDTLTLANDALGTIAAGTQLAGGAGTDKLGLFDTALSAGETTKLNAVTGFETLGLNAAITLDVSSLTSFRSFSVDTTGLTQTLSNLQSGVTTAFTTGTATSMTLAPALGVTSSAVSIAGGVTVTALVTTGLSTLSIASTGTTGTATITTLTTSDNASVTITGARATTIGAIAGPASTGNLVDGSAATGVLTITGSGQNDTIRGGTANDVINGGAGADTLTGNAGNDVFAFSTRAATKNGFAAGDTTTANIEKITDFNGNGALAGDSFQFAGTANVFGGTLDFDAATVANAVIAVTVATAADFTALTAAVETASAGVASTNTNASVYDVTVTAGNLAGRYLILNDNVATIAATDTIIAITGVTGALNANDFTFIA